MTGNPAPFWAQRAVGQQSPGGAYSWQDGRSYFYQALTANNLATREQHLAKTFRAVGQVMHLVQDMSVPEHTRDTTHMPWNYTIESFVEKIAGDPNHPYRALFKALLESPPISPDPQLLQQAGLLLNSPIPIANLYDAEMYEGANPAVTLGNAIGLAEYTNANFFSFNTIFKDFPNPALASVTEFEEADPVTGETKTFVRSGEVDHLAQAIVFKKYLGLVKAKGYTFEDDRIYLDYMQKLIPRAIGYSKAMLDYFFRGSMTLEAVPGGVTFRTVRVMAKNNTSTGEEMTGAGEYTLVVRYRAMTESGTGSNRTLLDPDDNYSYRVAKLQLPAGISRNTPVELAFDFSADPLPVNFADMTMQLVYKGKLGNEDGAVAISPLTAVDGIYTDFQLSLPSSGVFAKASGTSLNATFNEIRVTALADTPGGLSVPGGRFELAIEYQTATTDPFQSLPVDTEPANAAAYILRVPAKNGVTALPQGVPVEMVFDLSAAPLPVNATDVYLNVLYTDSVTLKTYAIGYRDISEPTPVDIFNNTDFACINNSWYPAGTPEAIAAADLAGNKNGFDDDTDAHPHNFINIYEKNSSASNPIKASASSFNFFEPGPVPPGSLKRMGYILTDYSFKYSFLPEWVHIDPNDGWTRTEAATLLDGSAVKNQLDSDEVYRYPGMYNMRGKLMWWGAGIVYDNVKLPLNGSFCPWEALQ